jgi:hypothetical protein
MIIQKLNESRVGYLLRVAAAYVEICPDFTIDYDETTCDGYCLSEELLILSEEINQSA